MALDVSLDNLREEVAAAKVKRDYCMEGVADSKARYQGPDRAHAMDEESDAPENVEFQFVSSRIPKMAFDVPAVRCDSPIFEVADEVAAFERGMNRWINESDTREVLLEAAYDFNFSWCCILVSRRPAEELGEVEMMGGTGVPQWPYMKRIPTELAYRDALASGPYKHRFAGHTMVADRDDLLRACDEHPEEEWNRDVIEAMADDAGLDAVRKARGSGPTRKEIAYDQVWVADAKIDWKTEALDEDGNEFPEEKRYLYNGKLFYIPVSSSSSSEKRRKDKGKDGWLRKPQPYFGPPSGPYVFGGEHIVPGDPYMMSTLTPNASAIRLLGDTVTSVNDGVKDYKNMGIVNDLVDPTLTDTIVNGKNGGMYTVPGYEHGQSNTLEVGGITNQMAAHVSVMRDRVDRGIGMDDGQYGRADADASATAVAVAADSSGDKTGFAKHQNTDVVQRALKIVGFYLWYDEEFAMPISLQDVLANGGDIKDYLVVDPETGEPKLDKKGQFQFSQPMLFGGTDKARSYASLQMKVEPISTERLSDAVAARNAATLTNTVAAVAPLVLQNPQIAWDTYFRAMGKYTSITEMPYLINMKAAAEMAGSQVLAEYADRMAAQKPELSGSNKAASGPSPKKAQTPGASQPRVQPAASPKPVKPGGMQGRATGGAAGQKAKAGAAA